MTPTWQSADGRVQLYCGDALAIVPKLAPGSIAAIVTDPPYSSGGMVRGDRMASTRDKYQQSYVATEHPEFSGDNRDQRGFVAWASLWLMYAMEITEDGGMLCMFSDWRQLPSVTDAIQAGGWVWRGILPWDKESARPMPNRFRQQAEFVVWGTKGARDFSTLAATYHPGILRGEPPPSSERTMAVEKPVDVMLPLVRVTQVDAIVADFFMGTGSTAIACIRTSRRFIGIEKGPCRFEQTRARIERELAQPRLPTMEPTPGPAQLEFAP